VRVPTLSASCTKSRTTTSRERAAVNGCSKMGYHAAELRWRLK
jgi:hypothetical protein